MSMVTLRVYCFKHSIFIVKKRSGRLAALFFAFGLSVTQYASARTYTFTPYIESDYVGLSEVLPVSVFFKDWKTGLPLRSGNAATNELRMEVGVRSKYIDVGYIEREFMYIRHNPQTAEFFYRVENRLPLEPGRDYAMLIDVTSLRAKGIVVGLSPPHKEWLRLGVQTQIFAADNLLLGHLSGTVRPLSASDYDYDNINVDYHYHKDLLFDRSVSPAIGHGLSTSVNLESRLGRKMRVVMVLKDLFSRVYWRNAPATVARINSDNKRYDERGYVVVDPTLSGRHLTSDVVQIIPSRTIINFEYLVSPGWFSTTRINLLRGEIAHSNIGVMKHLGSKKRMRLEYDLVTSAFGFAYESSWIQLSYAQNTMLIHKSNYISLSIGLNYALEF